MATNSEKTNIQMLDELFQAVDVITTKRLEHLQFNKTITCKIVDASNSGQGEYIVSDGSTEFFAYSENTRYREGIWVYVTIPNGDFNENKYIVGKYQADNTEYSTYTDPFDTYIDITGNLLTSNPEDVRGLIANNPNKDEIIIWETGDLSMIPQSYNDQYSDVDAINNAASDITKQLSKFNRLGLRANFKSLLNSYDIVSGNYGLKLNVVYMDPGTTSTPRTMSSIQLKLDTDNMFGNPYNFIVWSQQQLVFDISNLDNIVGMQLIFYQDKNFIDKNNNQIPLIDQNNTDQWNAYLSMANILTKDIYISLGYVLENFDEDKTFLYTFEPLTYASYLTDSNRELLNSEKYADLNFNLNTEAGVQRGLEIVNEKNLHLRWVHINEETNTASAIDDINDVATWQKADEQKPIIKVHWYRWKMEDGVEDPLAGVFWQEQTGLIDQFNWNSFQPDPMSPREKIKTIIEYPSLEYLEYNYSDALDDYLTSLPENILEEEQLKNEEYIDELHEALLVLKQQYLAALEEISNQYGIGTTEYYQEAQNLIKQFEEESVTEFPIVEEEEYWSPIAQAIEEFHASYLNSCILYESDILELTNEHDVPDYATIDLIRGLTLTCDADKDYGLRGIYNIYNPTGQIMNRNEASKLRFLTAKFDKVVTGDVIWDTIETIKWYIPVNNTMIELPVEGTEYTLTEGASTYAVSAGLDSSGEWFCIERQGIEIGEDRNPGELIPTTLEQIFRIKSYYTQTAINNTVRCEVYKNNRIYEAEITLYFGVHGTNGTDYTLIATYEEYKNDTWVPMVTPVFDWHGGPIRLVPHVYDYENVEVTEDYSINAFMGLFYASASGTVMSISKDTTDNKVSFIIKRKDDVTSSHEDYNNRLKYYHHIVKLTVTKAVQVQNTNLLNDDIMRNTELNVNLTTYCPIAIRFDNTYTELDGDNQVVYDYAGVNPIYYKGNYTLWKRSDNGKTRIKQTNVSWSINTEDKAGTTQFYPQIDASTGQLVVPSMFMSGNKEEVSILATVDDQVVWCQPLYIYQDVYSSTMLNSWDGSLTVDANNNTIMSAMVGAGFKDNENRFNGVLMGNVAKKIGVGKSSDTGLFGYHEGEQSFGWKIDGTGFIGKSGHGRIELNGNTGVIKSADYSNSAASGTQINIDEGIIDIRGDLEDGKQAKIHLGVKGTSNDPYFQIIDNVNSTKLIHISNSEQYIQSTGFSDTNRSGVKFDLYNKKLTGYNFTLKALTTYPSNANTTIGLEINSDGNPYINVKAAATYANHGNDIIEVFRISQSGIQQTAVNDNGDSTSTVSTRFFFKSSNYKAGTSGTFFDVENGKITSYSFGINAKYGGSEPGYANKWIRINSAASQYPLIIGTGTGNSKGTYDFAVKWDGSIYATRGIIGGWTINEQGFFSSSYVSQATFTGLALFNNSSGGDVSLSVGTVALNATYYILNGGNTSSVSYATWVAHSGDKFLKYSPSSSGFYISKSGILNTATALINLTYITGAYIWNAVVDVEKVGDLSILRSLKYQGTTYTSMSKTFVSGVSPVNVSATTDAITGVTISDYFYVYIPSSASLTYDNNGNPNGVSLSNSKVRSGAYYTGSGQASVNCSTSGGTVSTDSIYYLGHS